MQKIGKKVIITLVTMYFVLSSYIVCLADYNDYINNTQEVNKEAKIYDYAELIDSSDEEILYVEIQDFIKKYNMDMAIVTINQNNKASAMDYADDFYDYNKFGIGENEDGLLFLIDMDNREMWISTKGKAIKVFTDKKIDKILDYTYAKISNQDYFGCAREFIKYSNKYANPSYMSSKDILVVGSIATIATLVYLMIGLAKHKTVYKQTTAKDYMKDLKFTKNTDQFISTHTSRTRRESSSSSSSGGSSTHTSSSGSTHGGGRKKFLKSTCKIKIFWI